LRLVPPSGVLSPTDALRAFLAALPTPTAISRTIHVLIRLLLLYTARSRDASHLLLGTSLTTLSVSLISCVAQGGGYSVLEELQEEWPSPQASHPDIIGSIRLLRPLRDITMKECAAFAWWNGIHVPGRPKVMRATAGILGLTKGSYLVQWCSSHFNIQKISSSVLKKITRQRYQRLHALARSWNQRAHLYANASSVAGWYSLVNGKFSQLNLVFLVRCKKDWRTGRLKYQYDRILIRRLSQIKYTNLSRSLPPHPSPPTHLRHSLHLRLTFVTPV